MDTKKMQALLERIRSSKNLSAPQIATEGSGDRNIPVPPSSPFVEEFRKIQADSKNNIFIPTPGASKLQQMKEKLAWERSQRKNNFPVLISESPKDPEPTEVAITAAPSTISIEVPTKPDFSYILDKYGNRIHLNDKQMEFVEIAGIQGRSAVLIGAAGTGKTTCQKAVTQALIQTGKAGVLHSQGHKHLLDGSPGLVVCAYTRRAVANIRRNLPENLQSNAITIHKLLEYQPVYYEVIDPESGETKNKMVFEATRTAANPLPSSIRTIIMEEASMLGTDLHKELMDACPHGPQVIYLGDIQQLPPVFGPAILGFKLLELPVVELTEVYRQALESPIISLAHRILSGKVLPAAEFPEWKKAGQLTIHPWKKKIDAHNALNTVAQFFIGAVQKDAQGNTIKEIPGAFQNNLYDPEEDIILIPFNKSFGTIELNKFIANKLARIRKAETFQVIAGFNKLHFSVGDKVLYDKEDAVIEKIELNPGYTGANFAPASFTLDYWGHDPVVHTAEALGDEDVDFLLSQVAASGEDRVRQASHMITLRMLDSDTEVKIDKAAEVNELALGYCLTVHKSQGSEWRKVFFLCHQSHATMMQRELLYTAVTRAREELYVICEPETFVNGIESQRVKGNTLEEKAEYFKGKIENGYKPE
jgi:exodeoxyribonuclease V alpha subunit